jgi:short chain dehydrogenase
MTPKSSLARPTREQDHDARDRVVVITGASSGLGEAAARRLTKDGAKVELGARRLNGRLRCRPTIYLPGPPNQRRWFKSDKTAGSRSSQRRRTYPPVRGLFHEI